MRLGPYEILGELARGGMGVVLRGRAPDGKLVAIKVLGARTSGEAFARFERERRLLASFGPEDGFVPLLDAGESPRGPYIVMPLLEGGNLAERMRRGLAPGEVLELARALAATLGRAHERGIVHRDLKPENVLFDASGRPLVADLGLAKHFAHDAPGASESVSLSRSREMRGTVGYGAPEQWADAKSVGPAADVFALGAIFYECLAGRPAFSGESPLQVIGAIEDGRFEPLTRVSPETPRWLAGVVARCLERDPGKRWPDAGALARALEKPSAAPRALLVASGIVALCVAAFGVAFAARTAQLEGVEASPSPSPRSASPSPSATVAPALPVATKLPAACLGFTSTSATKLLAAYGSYTGRAADQVVAAAVSPDGRRALTSAVGLDRRLRVWDLATGELTGTLDAYSRLSGGGKIVTAAAFLPDGRRALLGTDSGKLALWDVDSGQAIATIESAHAGGVTCVAIAPDGQRAFTGGNDARVRAWAIESGALRSLGSIAHHKRLTSIALSLDGSQAITGSDDGKIRLFDLVDLTENNSNGVAYDDHALGAVLAFRPDGRTFVSGQEGGIVVWDVASRRALARSRSEDRHRDRVVGVAVSPDGSLAATGSTDGTMKVWSLPDAKLARTLDGGSTGLICVAPVAGGRRVLAGGHDGALQLWDVASGRSVWRGRGGYVIQNAFLPDGRSVVSARFVFAHGLEQWSVATGRVERTFPDQGEEARADPGSFSVAIAPDGRRLLKGRANGVLEEWDVPGSKHVNSFEGHKGTLFSAAISPDGKRALTGGFDKTARLWTLGGGVGFVWPNDDPVNGVVFLNARRGAYATWSGKISIREVVGGTEVRAFEHPGMVYRIAASADGTRLISTGADGTARLWDVESGRELAQLRGHLGWVLDAVFLADGKRAATSGDDGTIRIWDLASAREVDRIDLASSSDFAYCLAVSPDGRLLVAGTGRGMNLVFELKRP